MVLRCWHGCAVDVHAAARACKMMHELVPTRSRALCLCQLRAQTRMSHMTLVTTELGSPSSSLDTAQACDVAAKMFLSHVISDCKCLEAGQRSMHCPHVAHVQSKKQFRS